MTREHWDAEEFVERMIRGDRSVAETLADLSAEESAELELVLARRDLYA